MGRCKKENARLLTSRGLGTEGNRVRKGLVFWKQLWRGLCLELTLRLRPCQSGCAQGCNRKAMLASLRKVMSGNALHSQTNQVCGCVASTSRRREGGALQVPTLTVWSGARGWTNGIQVVTKKAKVEPYLLPTSEAEDWRRGDRY